MRFFAYTQNIDIKTDSACLQAVPGIGGCMLRFFQTEKTNDNHYTLLMDDLRQTAQELRDAYRNLGNVIDPDLIDCYIYELNSVQMRYKFLLTSIKNYEACALSHDTKQEDSYAKNPLEVSKF